jgi:hypothetical protein
MAANAQDGSQTSTVEFGRPPERRKRLVIGVSFLRRPSDGRGALSPANDVPGLTTRPAHDGVAARGSSSQTPSRSTSKTRRQKAFRSKRCHVEARLSRRKASRCRLFLEPKVAGCDFLRGMRQSRRYSTVSRLALAGWLVLGACSSERHETDGSSPNLEAGGAAAEEVSCTDDPRVEIFSEGLKKVGEGGITVTLDGSDPEPPARGENAWHVTVLDADGQPLSSAQLEVVAQMPDHGHMSPTTPEATATDAEGRSTISGLNLFMAGVWVVHLSITVAEKPIDSVSFALCVEG